MEIVLFSFFREFKELTDDIEALILSHSIKGKVIDLKNLMNGLFIPY